MDIYNLGWRDDVGCSPRPLPPHRDERTTKNNETNETHLHDEGIDVESGYHVRFDRDTEGTEAYRSQHRGRVSACIAALMIIVAMDDNITMVAHCSIIPLMLCFDF